MCAIGFPIYSKYLCRFWLANYYRTKLNVTKSVQKCHWQVTSPDKTYRRRSSLILGEWENFTSRKVHKKSFLNIKTMMCIRQPPFFIGRFELLQPHSFSKYYLVSSELWMVFQSNFFMKSSMYLCHSSNKWISFRR